jgi:hypothetical protein
MNTKIGLPSDDKLIIADCCIQSRFFKITTVEKGQIIHEEYRNNTSVADNFLCQPGNNCPIVYELISDCDVFITNNINEELASILKDHNKQLVLTSEKIITNAVLRYIIEATRKESDTCCCP